MDKKIYHIGLVKKNQFTLILEMRENIDLLSCECWKYFGQRITTKESIKRTKNSLLDEINKSYNTDYKYIIIQ